MLYEFRVEHWTYVYYNNNHFAQRKCVFNLRNFNIAVARFRLEWTNFRHILRARHELAKMKSTRCGVRTAQGFICQLVYFHLSSQFAFQSPYNKIFHYKLHMYSLATEWMNEWNEWQERFPHLSSPARFPQTPSSVSFASTLSSLWSLYACTQTYILQLNDPRTTNFNVDGTIASKPPCTTYTPTYRSHNTIYFFLFFFVSLVVTIHMCLVCCLHSKICVCAVSFASTLPQLHLCSGNILVKWMRFYSLEEYDEQEESREKKNFPT